ncbi:MAG: hypothetical protein N3E45_15465 [Oscillatoriaceae bacterium SKW80]|nr:hypothetical protein [Oscillatoriaceae bacterium SKW80]HIK29344.1 hypothetical protein [Oscillatoriaceae cyanobacterium M7585_C2015_266]
MPINSPVRGYVEARFLTACMGVIPSAANNSCRKVESISGLNVREQPSANSRALAG